MVAKREPREDSLEWLEKTYPTEASVRTLFERLVWPDGAHCPHCGSLDVWRFRNKGRSSRDGLFECRHCRGQFTVTTKTPMHATKLPLRTWLKALRDAHILEGHLIRHAGEADRRETADGLEDGARDPGDDGRPGRPRQSARRDRRGRHDLHGRTLIRDTNTSIARAEKRRRGRT
ncbi:transposase (plasmid) [Labrenzia sp. 5N]|nr:transposase [Labrenzia sp. R5_0]NKX68224.1 transposase [Labrenzia sp. 5N]UES41912.1 hypothetical protein GFC08_28245 [Roseibium aggregatum]